MADASSAVMAGLAESMSWLIGWRAVQGIGAGGLQALAQVVIAALIPPRERGRYSGYMGAVMAVSTVSGPLLGGVIVDSALGWRWCFYVCIPLAVISLFILQTRLKVFTERRTPKIDFAGAADRHVQRVVGVAQAALAELLRDRGHLHAHARLAGAPLVERGARIHVGELGAQLLD